MADGDITAIKELGRAPLPIGGFVGITGTPSTNKVMVWGTITCTYAAAGVDLGAEGGTLAIGIKEQPDLIRFAPRQGGATATANPTSLKGFLANLKPLTNLIFICDEVGADDPSVPTPGETFTLDYFAVGEDTRKAIDLG
jgi:hypothetical protein